MKKSELKQIIKEEISKVLSENKTLLGKQVDPEFDIFTYDHLLPKGTGDNFTPKQFSQMLNAAKSDAQILKQQGRKIKIQKDDGGLPYLEII